MIDEVCSDRSFEELENTVKARPDDLIEEIDITPDGETCWEDLDLEYVIEYKLKVIGIDVEQVRIERNSLKLIESCIIKIKAMQFKKLERNFPFLRWNCKQYIF